MQIKKHPYAGTLGGSKPRSKGGQLGVGTHCRNAQTLNCPVINIKFEDEWRFTCNVSILIISLMLKTDLGSGKYGLNNGTARMWGNKLNSESMSSRDALAVKAQTLMSASSGPNPYVSSFRLRALCQPFQAQTLMPAIQAGTRMSPTSWASCRVQLNHPHQMDAERM